MSKDDRSLQAAFSMTHQAKLQRQSFQGAILTAVGEIRQSHGAAPMCHTVRGWRTMYGLTSTWQVTLALDPVGCSLAAAAAEGRGAGGA